MNNDFYQMGYDHGRSVASWLDIPGIGDLIDRSVDLVGYGKYVTVNNLLDYTIMLAQLAEENSRQFSPFEFTAQELNDQDDPDETWELFEEGINDAIIEYLTPIVYDHIADTAYFDRFDICYAYLALENDYNVSGVLQERKSNNRRKMSTGYQLSRKYLQFNPGHGFNGFDSLSENGKAIYFNLMREYGFDFNQWRKDNN